MSAADIVENLVNPINKLLDIVDKYIGKAYEPRHIRKMANAQAYQIEKISETARNNIDIPIQYSFESVSIDTSDFKALCQRTSKRIAYQEIQKQLNIENVIDYAYKNLETIKNVTAEKIAEEWTIRYFDIIGDILSNSMQEIYGKVLAGEISNPGSYSLKTLECLRNLSSKDAEVFAYICKYVINDSFIYSDVNLNEKYGIKYDDILTLDDCGLVNSDGRIALHETIKKEPVAFLDFGKRKLWISTKEESSFCDIQISQFPLTRAGKELLSVARQETVPDDYVQDIVQDIKKRYTFFEYSLQ